MKKHQSGYLNADIYEIRYIKNSIKQRLPLPGADSPYQGEMSRRDKRGRDAGSAKPRLRGCWKFATAIASGGPIFSVLPEKIGEKRVLGYGLVLPASVFRQEPIFQASFHTILTLRASWYAPPDT